MDLWNFSISPEIDEDHRNLFEILARCETGTHEQEQPEANAARMAELLEHVAMHFYTEEVFMRRIGFPGFERHKAEHEAIARAAFALAEQFLTTGLAVAEIVDSAARSLKTHLVKSDSAIACFIHQERNS